MPDPLEEPESPKPKLSGLMEFGRTTMVGGLLFLFPICIVVVVIGKVMGPLSRITKPLAEWIGLEGFPGLVASTMIEVLALALTAFLAGLLARTKGGQQFIGWLRSGIATVLPRASLLQDIAQSFDQKAKDVPVVLVPTDAGWTIGVLVERQHEGWCTVFLPGSPDMFNGSISYVHPQDVRATDLTAAQLWSIVKARGAGSRAVYPHLAVQAEPPRC